MPTFATLREAMIAFGLVTKKLIDVEFINPFIAAAIHVLEVHASTPSTAGKPLLKKDNTKFIGDISVVIGVVSESFNGSIVISFTQRYMSKNHDSNARRADY